MQNRPSYRINGMRVSRRNVLRYGVIAAAGLAAMPLIGCGSEKQQQSAAPMSPPSAVPASGFFDSDGVKIHYETLGEGAPIVLVHGFTASFRTNWGVTGWIDTLRTVRRVVGLDCRGHGESDKPHDPAAYGSENMGGDVLRLMDYLGIEKADIFGYSMGAYISADLLADHGDRFSSVILGGITSPFEYMPPAATQLIADALLADDPSQIKGRIAQTFRAVADANPNNDRQALAACITRVREQMSPADFADVDNPVLIVVGGDDVLSPNPQALADAIAGAKVVQIPGRDHLTVLTDQRFKDEALGFLSQG